MKINAIYIVFNEAPFITASLAAVYPHVDQIVIVSQYDTDFWGMPYPPDATIETMLKFPDPLKKIRLGVRRHFSNDSSVTEAAMRNWGMLELGDPCDYWWVVDADEIYDPAQIPKFLAWIEREKPYGARIQMIHYFKKWNYPVTVQDTRGQIALVRHGHTFRKRRRAKPPFPQRVIAWLARLGKPLYDTVPDNVCIIHHGSFIGDNERMKKKITSSGHRDEIMARWYEEVWLKWTPESKNFNPIKPEHFPSVRHVPTANLPATIRDAVWPEGWIEPLAK